MRPVVDAFGKGNEGDHDNGSAEESSLLSENQDSFQTEIKSQIMSSDKNKGYAAGDNQEQTVSKKKLSKVNSGQTLTSQTEIPSFDDIVFKPVKAKKIIDIEASNVKPIVEKNSWFSSAPINLYVSGYFCS